MKKYFPYIMLIVLLLLFPLGIHNIYASHTSPVKIAVLDTVAYLQHPDLIKHIVGGYNFVSNQPIDIYEPPTHFHGTHITGIICATGYAQGVYPDAEILYYVIDSPDDATYHQNISKAIYRAIQDGAKIINFSGKLASDLSDTRILQAISYALQNNVVFVKSSGNSGPELWSVHDLATSQDVLSVGAYDTATDKLYELSSRGPAFGTLKIKPDLVAPGVDILSTAPFADGNYLKASGTSMASAYTSGALGLITSKRPSLSSNLLVSALINNATPLVDEYGKPYSVLAQGAGAINIPNTLEADVICTPHQLSFVLDSTKLPHTLTSQLAFINTSLDIATYSLSFEPEIPSQDYHLSLPSSITLMPNETLVVPIKLTIAPTISPNHYGGRIYFRNDSSTKNVPFLLEIPSEHFPIVRGFCTSTKIVSFSKTNDFRFVFETSLPSTLTLFATQIDTDKTYTLFEEKPITSSIQEIGWDGKAPEYGLLPDGLYEISGTFKSDDLSSSFEDVMLLIDNTSPHFQEIIFSKDTNYYTVQLVLSDLMISQNHVIDIAYRNHPSPLSPLSVSYSINGLDYTAFELKKGDNKVSFTIPKDTEKIHLKALDFTGNTTTKILSIPHF